jgi:hypothetical protein
MHSIQSLASCDREQMNAVLCRRRQRAEDASVADLVEKSPLIPRKSGQNEIFKNEIDPWIIHPKYKLKVHSPEHNNGLQNPLFPVIQNVSDIFVVSTRESHLRRQGHESTLPLVSAG